jgi:hypothetical protein
MLCKIRLLVLSLLLVMVFGAVASMPAWAEPGPWWHHRAAGEKGNGLKIEKNSPEKFEGEGTGTELVAKFAGTAISIKCDLKAKGSIWNETNQGQEKFAQGQGKVLAAYEKCEAKSLEGCTVTVTPSGSYTFFLVWKYEGNATELENKKQTLQGQHFDAAMVPAGVTIVSGAEGKEAVLKEKKSFAELKFAKSCGVLNGVSSEAEGAIGFTSEISLEQFTKDPTIKFPGAVPNQHIWMFGPFPGFIPVKLPLTLSNEEAKFSGELPIVFASQEVGVFET